MATTKTRARRDFSRDVSTVRAPILVRDGAEVTEDAVWAWFLIDTHNTDHLEEAQAEAVTARTATELRSLIPTGAAYHLKVLWTPHSAAEYRESVSAVTGNLAPGWHDWVELGAASIDALSGSVAADDDAGGVLYRRKMVLLGVQVAGAQSGRRPLADHPLVRRLASPTAAAKDAHERLEQARPAIQALAKRFKALQALTAREAPAALLAWSYAREFAGSAAPAPPEQGEFGRSRLAALVAGQARRSADGLYMELTDARTGHVSYVATLVAAVDGFPASEMVNPGSEWLQTVSDVAGVEISLRGQHHGQTASVGRLEKAGRTVRSQLRDADAAGAEAAEELYDADETIKSRRATVRHREDVLAMHHPRWVVHADSPAQLRDRVDAVVDHYAGLVRLEWLPWIQDLLWCETLPGDTVRVPEFGQEQPLITLAGSMFHGGSALGDGLGPYLGANLGSTPGPVQVHVVRRDGEHRHDSTTITCTGLSGMGKSTTVMRLVLDALAEGSWAMLVDVKGDLGGCPTVARDMLGIPAQVLDVTSPECAGMLDPLRFAATPDEARNHAITALQMALTDDEARRYGAIIESAVEKVMTRPEQQRSMPAVLGELTAADTAEWTEVGEILTTRAQQTGLRLVCQPAAPNAAPISAERGLVYLDLSALPLPDPQEPASSWKSPQRGAMVALQMAFAFAMEQARTKRSLKKLVALTELHRITGFPVGRALVAQLARMGRALQTYLLLDSQGAEDLAQVEQVVEQTVMAFASRGATDSERAAQAALLGRPDAGPVITDALNQLRRGEALMRDRYGRIGRIGIDLMDEWVRDSLDTSADDDNTPTAQPTPEEGPEPEPEPAAGEGRPVTDGAWPDAPSTASVAVPAAHEQSWFEEKNTTTTPTAHPGTGNNNGHDRQVG